MASSHMYPIPDLVVDYQSACDLFGQDNHRQWKELGLLLGGRPGWWCGIHDPYDGDSLSLLWSFGSFHASLINMHVTANGTFYCHDHLRDNDPGADLETSSIEQVRNWLAEHEPAAFQYRGPRDWSEDSGYQFMKVHRFQLSVTFTEGAFIGTVPDVPVDATIQATLPGVIQAARQMIGDHFDLPAEVSAALTIQAILSPEAVREVGKAGGP